MKCSHCGKENPEDAKYCAHCGKTLTVNSSCAKCGHQNPSGTKFCVNCGEPLHEKEKRKQKGKKENPSETSKKKIKPVWFILIAFIFLFVIGGYFLIFHIPRACRPLADALESNQEFQYGCDTSNCYLWLTNLDDFDDLEIIYRWGESDPEHGPCLIEPNSPELRCTIALPQEAEDLLISIASEECSLSFTTLSREEMQEVMPASDQVQQPLSTDPETCSDFITDVNELMAAYTTNISYDPLEVFFYPITLDGYDQLGLRYEWSNGVNGTIACKIASGGDFMCSVPSEFYQTGLTTWLNDGICETGFYTLTENEFIWDQYDSCSVTFIETIKNSMQDWYFTYDPDETMADLFVFHAPGLEQIENATMYFLLNDEVMEEPADRCILDEEGPGGTAELKCYIMLEEIPESISVLVADGDCHIYMTTFTNQEIQSFIETNQ